MEVEGSSRQYLRWKPAYVAEDERKQIVSQRSTVDIALENAEIWQHNEQHGNTVDRDGDVGCCGYILMTFSVLLLISLFPFSLLFSIKVISEFERAVIFRLGRVINGAKGPGMIFVFPCVEQMLKVDLRTVAYDVPPQEILTKDSVTVSVDAVIYYRVSDPVMSICNVTDAVRSAQLLSATVLRNVMGMKVMAEVLTERDHMAMLMQEMLDKATDAWGIKVERVEIKDVRLPLQLQRAMAAEAEAAREARAKVVAAEGEQNASRPLKEAADVIMESPAALQLRYLQTLGSIATESSSTMLFPVPINMLSAFVKKDDKTDNSFTASYREESFKRSYDKIDEMNFTKEEGFTEFGQEERKKRENSLDFLNDEKRSETLRLSDTKIQYDVTPENELEFLSGLVQSVQGWQQGETSISTNTSQSSTAHLRSGVSETEQTSHDSMNFAVESEVHRRHSTDVNGHPRQRLPVEVVQIDNHMEGGTNNVGTEENIELRSGGSSSVHIQRGRHSTKIVIGEHQPT